MKTLISNFLSKRGASLGRYVLLTANRLPCVKVVQLLQPVGNLRVDAAWRLPRQKNFNSISNGAAGADVRPDQE